MAGSSTSVAQAVDPIDAQITIPTKHIFRTGLQAVSAAAKLAF
jgi:hypothetical protein